MSTVDDAGRVEGAIDGVVTALDAAQRGSFTCSASSHGPDTSIVDVDAPDPRAIVVDVVDDEVVDDEVVDDEVVDDEVVDGVVELDVDEEVVDGSVDVVDPTDVAVVAWPMDPTLPRDVAPATALTPAAATNAVATVICIRCLSLMLNSSSLVDALSVRLDALGRTP